VVAGTVLVVADDLAGMVDAAGRSGLWPVRVIEGGEGAGRVQETVGETEAVNVASYDLAGVVDA